MNAYTYLIGWSEHGKFYYGAQWNKKASPSDLWTRYFTSSNRVKKFREKHGEPDVIQIRKTFGEAGCTCREWEERVLMKLKKNTASKWLNTRVSNKNWFSPTNSVMSLNTVTGVVSRVSKDEFESNPELVGQTIGMVSAKNVITGESVYVSKDEFASNPDLVHNMKGYVPSDEIRKVVSNRFYGKVFARTEEGDIVHVSKDVFSSDDRLVSLHTGIPKTEDHKRKIRKSKIGKSRPLHVGKAVGDASRGMVSVLDKTTGKKARVTAEEFKNSPNLVGCTSGRVITDEENRQRSASLLGKTSGMVTCRDIRSGEKMKVSKAEFVLNPYLVGMRSRVLVSDFAT